MKTKEIDVWFNDEDFGTQSGTIWFGKQVVNRNPLIKFNKAKLIIEVPEKKIEITESEFDDVFVSILNTSNILNHMDLKRIKQKIGFGND